MEHNVDERTFDRDIEDIRLFLSDMHYADELLFDRVYNAYYISGQRPTYMDRMYATAISKIVLESKTLRKDEMDGLIQVVLSLVKTYDREAIQKYLSYDLKEYTSKTKNAILKFIGDLYATIKAGYDIEIEFDNKQSTSGKIKVSPLNLECVSNEFNLVVAENFNIDRIKEIPVDRINCFKKLNTTFARELKEKYYKTKEE